MTLGATADLASGGRRPAEAELGPRPRLSEAELRPGHRRRSTARRRSTVVAGAELGRELVQGRGWSACAPLG